MNNAFILLPGMILLLILLIASVFQGNTARKNCAAAIDQGNRLLGVVKEWQAIADETGKQRDLAMEAMGEIAAQRDRAIEQLQKAAK